MTNDELDSIVNGRAEEINIATIYTDVTEPLLPKPTPEREVGSLRQDVTTRFCDSPVRKLATAYLQQ